MNDALQTFQAATRFRIRESSRATGDKTVSRDFGERFQLTTPEYRAALGILSDRPGSVPPRLSMKQVVRNETLEEAALIARGHQDGDGFEKHGTRQLYWKGRSDAATEIRAKKEKSSDKLHTGHLGDRSDG